MAATTDIKECRFTISLIYPGTYWTNPADFEGIAQRFFEQVSHTEIRTVLGALPPGVPADATALFRNTSDPRWFIAPAAPASNAALSDPENLRVFLFNPGDDSLWSDLVITGYVDKEQDAFRMHSTSVAGRSFTNDGPTVFTLEPRIPPGCPAGLTDTFKEVNRILSDIIKTPGAGDQ